MARLTGKETFEFDGSPPPRSMLLYDLKCNMPKHSYAHGFLLSISIDAFRRACEAERSGTIEPVLKKYVIGKISIEMGGTLYSPQIGATTLGL